MIVNEIFKSIQAEGLSIGVPSVFVRFYGCNANCSWCDSMYSIDGNEFEKYSPTTLFEKIKDTTEGLINNIVFTGGEPILQLRTKEGITLLEKFTNSINNYNIEIETNGSLVKDILHIVTSTVMDRSFLQLNISPKFINTDKFKWRDIYLKNNYFKNLLKKDLKFKARYQVKFVLEREGIKRSDCIKNILETCYINNISPDKVCIMTEGKTRKEQSYEQMQMDIELCMKYGFNYTPRLHILVWDRQRGV